MRRRRLARVLLNAATAVSMVLCVVSVIGFLVGIPSIPVTGRYALYSTGLRLEVWDHQSSRGRPAYAIPWGLMILGTAVLPLVRSRSRRRAKARHSAGLCPACGYDLRATPDPPGRCPECGAAPAAPPA